MGVLGLTPFLLKSFPSVVKELPDRFKQLAGKRIVIDGTLITQRLHFAPSPHPYRHVLGWYKILGELKEFGVSAICVFDGKDRSKAKAPEAERRRQAQRLTAARGSLENSRLKRLGELGHVLRHFRSLDSANQNSTINLLQKMNLEPDAMISSLKDASPMSTMKVDHPQDTAPPFTSGAPIRQPDRPSTAIDNQLLEAQFTTLDISQTLISLYLQYRQSITKLASLSSLPTPSLHQADPVDSLMTKAQHQLTMAEGALWNSLASPSVSDEDAHLEPESALTSLTDQSRVMYESYYRRTNTPTQRTYKESQDIIRAMGVPCIEPDGPFEAEALASSMVLEGLADYVASEDTDVLVYEAPLIRNITSRQAPLMLISGTDVRQALELDRSAYVDFALLLGTDFSQRIRNVGPSRALKFIKEHGSIEHILESEIKYPPRIAKEEYLSLVGIAREVFQTLPPTPGIATIEQRESEDAEIMWVMQRYGLGQIVSEEQQYYASALDGNYFRDNPSGT
ncbi:PIN domain-like protein [Infundibulicybe gibba]|nr:PIN domain-like protein [Infundibulicybe gibba]